MTTILVTLFEHNRWANLRTAEACAGLTDAQWDATVPGTMGTVRTTLLHIAAAEQRYVYRLGTGTDEHFAPEMAHKMWGRDDWPGLERVRAALDESGRMLADLAAKSDPADTVKIEWRGEARSIPASTLYVQAINHATEHRSQIFTILTQQGLEPPDVSGWAFGT